MLDVGVRGSSNASDSEANKIDSSIVQNWRKYITRTEIFIVEKLTGPELRAVGYEETGLWPNPIMLLLYLITWPFQLAMAFTLNLGRMGNPLIFIKQRIMSER